MNDRRIRQVLSISFAAWTVALTACGDGPLDSEESGHFSVQLVGPPPCVELCVQGEEYSLDFIVGRSTPVDLYPEAGVLVEFEGEGALELAERSVRTGPDGIARAIVRMGGSADRAAIRARVPELPHRTHPIDSVLTASVSFGIVEHPPVIRIAPDSLVFSEPGCEGEATWSLMSGDRVLPFSGDFSVAGEAIAEINRVGMHIVKARAEGRTRLNVWQTDGASRISSSMPIVVLGPFTPTSFTAGFFALALGTEIGWSDSVQGLCRIQSVSDGLRHVSLDPDIIATDAAARRTTAVGLGQARLVRSWQALEDTVSVSTWDYRALPLDTTVAPGAEFEYRGEIAHGSVLYRAMGFNYDSYLQLTSSNPQVVSIRLNPASYGGIARANAPGTATITAVFVDRHGHERGPPRTAKVVVAPPAEATAN